MTFISFVHSALWTKGIGDKKFVHVVLLTQFLFSLYGYESKLIDSFIFLFFWRGGGNVCQLWCIREILRGSKFYDCLFAIPVFRV